MTRKPPAVAAKASATQARKARGAWYTPDELARTLARRTLEGLEPGATVVDLACGDGALLAAAAEVGDFRLVGFDLDADAVAAARARLPAGQFAQADGLIVDVGPVHAVLGNPPFLFGTRRPAAPPGFVLARGQWDTAWLFLERAIGLVGPAGRVGFVLPDSLLARHETTAVRGFVRSHCAAVWVRHDAPKFRGAHVATVLLTARVGVESCVLEMENRGHLLKRDGPWPPPPPVPAHWARLGDMASISRGEELGKKSLRRLDPSSSAGGPPRGGVRPGEVAVVVGEGIVSMGQPVATHAMLGTRVRKPAAHYRGPKVVVAKTGRTVRAGVDELGLTTLQSVYNVHPLVGGVERARFLCGVLCCDEVLRRFVLPHTSGKKVFPQITKTLLASIRLPPETPELVRGVAGAVAQGDEAELNALTTAWFSST